MNNRHKPRQAAESLEQEIEEHVERTDEKHAKKPPRETRGMGELQRDPKRAMQEAAKARERKKKD